MANRLTPYSRRVFLKLSAAHRRRPVAGDDPGARRDALQGIGPHGRKGLTPRSRRRPKGQDPKFTDSEAVAIMRTAADEGINIFDNAWSYTDGLCEERMGLALMDGYRERVCLMTKDTSRDPVQANSRLEESLRRLRTDVVDLWQFHNIYRADEPERIYEEGLIEAALKAKEQGKIRYIGFIGHTDPALHLEMIERGFAWDAVQMPVSVFDPHYLNFVEQVLPVAVEKGIGVIAMKTMAGTPGVIPSTGTATSAECLRFAMSLPVSTVSSGMDSLEKLRRNIAVARDYIPMEDDERHALLARTATEGRDGQCESYKARRP